jgi:hypothetical protein
LLRERQQRIHQRHGLPFCLPCFYKRRLHAFSAHGDAANYLPSVMADEREAALFEALACIPPTMPIRAAALCGLCPRAASTPASKF